MATKTHKKCKVIYKPRNPLVSELHNYHLKCGHEFKAKDSLAMLGDKAHCIRCCKVPECQAEYKIYTDELGERAKYGMMFGSEIGKLIENKTIIIDAQGHFGSEDNAVRKLADKGMLIWFTREKELIENRKHILECIGNNAQCDFIPIGVINELYPCWACGEGCILLCDGKTIKTNTKCLYPNGSVPCSFEVSFPSGRVVAIDDIRQWIKPTDYDEYDIMTAVGSIGVTQAFAKLNCAHFYVGNSCPGIRMLNNDEFFVGNIGTYKKKRGKRVAGVITDLWWVSLVDYDQFLKVSGMKEIKYPFEVFDVEPGTYTFQYYVYDKSFVQNKDGCKQIYAHAKRKN